MEESSFSRSDFIEKTPSSFPIAAFLLTLVLACFLRAGIGLRHERFRSARCGCQPTGAGAHSQFRSSLGSRDLPKDLSNCSSNRLLLDRSQEVPAQRLFGRHQRRILSRCGGVQSRGGRLRRNLVPGAFHRPLICFTVTTCTRRWESTAGSRTDPHWPSGQPAVPSPKPECLRV